jgi:hypothetical protein
MNKIKVFLIAVLTVFSFAVTVFAKTPHHAVSQPFGVAQGLPVLVIDSSKMPTIAAHIRLAQAQGYPSTLTRLTNEERIKSNRQAACGNFARPAGYECDEYPFASTYEGGQGASVAAAPPHEQRVQGGTISAFYRKLQDGSQFTVSVR